MQRNILDSYQQWTTQMVADHLSSNAHPAAVLMEQIAGDFNFGTVVRCANAFNFQTVYYLGKKKWDRRGAVGTHHYTNVHHLPDVEHLQQTIAEQQWTPVAVDNVPGARNIMDVTFPERPLFMFGEEGSGLSEHAKQVAHMSVSIPQWGSVRSLNAGVAAGIVLYEYVRQHGRHDLAVLSPSEEHHDHPGVRTS